MDSFNLDNMKKISWALIIVYLAIFILVGLIFYLFYAEKIFLPSLIQPSPSSTAIISQIYYGLGNNLYRLNSELKTNPEEDRIERFQSTGKVISLDIDNVGLKIAYDAKNARNKISLWLVDTITNKQTLVTPADKKDFQDFLKPDFSPDGTKLAYLGQTDQTHQIIIKNLLNNSETILKPKIKSQTATYSWSKDSKKIIFCSENLADNACYQVEIANKQESPVFKGQIEEISWDKTDKIVILKKEDAKKNIFLANENGQDLINLTNLEPPMIAGQFRIDNQGEKIIYEVWNGDRVNIYSTTLTGTETRQLTTDNISSNPIWSNDSEKIAYLKKYQGIFISFYNQSIEKKIANLTQEDIRLLYWR